MQQRETLQIRKDRRTTGMDRQQSREKLTERCRRYGLLLLMLVGIGLFGHDRASAQQFGDPCDSISITQKFVSAGCCWDFTLNNIQSLQAFDDIKITVLTPGASVTSGAGGLPTTTTAISINHAFPNGLPTGQTTVRGCFDAPGGFLSIIFEWKYQGETVCRDTLEIDCPPDQGKDTCATDTLKISTGWNPYDETLHSTGDYTSFWQVVSDPDATTTEPRPASVITKNPAWDGPLGVSQWISSYPTASNDKNGTYIFESCFCVKEGARNVRLVFDILADDRARVYINGNLVGGTPLSWGFKTPANHVDSNITQFIRPGRNCIRVEVDNTNSVAMGLDLDGFIIADGLGLERAACCDPTSVLTGAKYHDLNCNGKRDAGEPGIPGWKIVLSNGDTATTDGLGNYYFYNVPAGNWIIAEINQPGWTQTAPATGTHSVSLTAGGAIGGLDFGNCSDDKPVDCFNYRADTTICEDQSPAGGQIYLHQFGIRPLLPCQYNYAAGFTSLTPGVNVNPTSIPSLPSGWSAQTLVVTGPGATPGTVVVVEIKICCVAGQPGAPGDTVDCCTDTIRFVLPECDDDPQDCKDCCEEFPKHFERLSQWSSSSGTTSVKGLLQAGNTQICKVTATLVEARINGQPTWGQFIPTSNLGGTPGVSAYMHDVTWTGVDVSSGLTPFNLRLRFPGVARGRFTDRIDYCVRFTYTDKNCVSCDTVICFSQRRYKWLFPGGFTNALERDIEIDDDKQGGPAAAPAATFEGALTDTEQGTLTVNFPEGPPELGEIRYVGLEIDPAEEFVEITGGTSTDYTYYNKAASFGIASEPFSIAPGGSTTVDLTYNDGSPNRNRLDHWITIRFVRTSDPSDTLEENGRVTFFRENFKGGDILELGKAQPTEARTYALYLQAKNASEEPLSALDLSTPKGVEILAIGPGTEENEVALHFIDDADRDAAAIDLTGAATTVPATGTIGPIYVTVATDQKEFALDFTTRNRFGTVVSEGSITIDNDPTSVHDAGGSAGSDNRMLSALWPNPANRNTTVALTLQQSRDEVSISIVDARGRRVGTVLSDSRMHGGEHRLLVDTSELPGGNYHILVESDGDVETLPLRVVR